MKLTSVACLASVCGWLLGAVAPSQALAADADDQAARKKTQREDIDRARSHFLRGADLFREGNYEAALIEFKRANEIAPNYRILYNIGQTYQELQNYTGALDSFQRYLEMGGNKIDAERRAYVEQQIEKLRGRVASVTLHVNVSGADVLVDDTPVATTPLSGPLLVSAGKRKITVSKPPAVPVVKFIEVAGGDRVDLNIDLALPKQMTSNLPPTRNGNNVAPKTIVVREDSPGLSTGFWIGLVSTGALTVGASVTGVMALSARSDLDQELGTYPTTAQRIEDAKSKTETLALTTDILAGAALVSGAITIYLAADNKPDDQPSIENKADSVSVDVGPGTVWLTGSF